MHPQNVPLIVFKDERFAPLKSAFFNFEEFQNIPTLLVLKYSSANTVSKADKSAPEKSAVSSFEHSANMAIACFTELRFILLKFIFSIPLFLNI